MGKPNSYLFCRMHDMRAAFFDETGQFQYVSLALSLPKKLESFGKRYPEFSKNDEVFAICYLIDEKGYSQYKKFADAYGGDLSTVMDEILNHIDELDRLLQDNPTDTSIIYLMVLCMGIRERNLPDIMAGAYGLLGKVLDMEEQGTIDPDEELTAWISLATFLDFEEIHDKTFGSPIVGKSPYYNKDKNGNPINNENSDDEYNTSSTKSGGCYVATAVYGSYDCPQVWTLRRYRDYDLATHWYGRAFIRTYYTISPIIVEKFGDKDWFNNFWRAKLDKMVKNLQDKGVESTVYKDKQW